MITDNKTFKRIALFLLFLSFAVTYSEPLWDIDLWWHVATGRYVVENKGLLESDPFCYTSLQEGITPGREIILNGYWLSQVIFYCAYAVFSDYGLIAIRVILLLAILFTIYLLGRRIGATDSSIIFVLIFAGWLSVYFTGERPQLFSFLFAPIVLYLLEDIKKACSEQGIADKQACSEQRVACRKDNSEKQTTPYTLLPKRYTLLFAPYTLNAIRYTLLPAVMLLWANLHGGFVMGTALIAIFTVSEAIKLFFKKGMNYKPFFIMCVIIGLAIAASFLNPNTYKPYVEVVKYEGSILQQRTSEYMSPITLTLQYKQFLAPYWLYLLFVLSVFGISFKRVDRTHLVIVIFLTAVSLSAFRYIPFLIYTTAPVTAFYLSKTVEGRSVWKRLLNIFAGAAVIVVLIVTITGFNNSLGKTLKHEIKEYRFPEAAASFVLGNHPSGNIFNNFNWGGYLIWRLYPDYKVFIDGRTLSMKAFIDYTHILWNESEAKSLFDYYGINVIIIPGLSPFTGELYELVNILKDNEQWHLVFADETAMIFVRGAENQDIIRRFSLPKAEAYTHVIKQAGYKLRTGAQSPYLWLALERAYREKGLIHEAMQAHENVLKMQGRH